MARRVLTLVDRIKKNIALPEMKILPGQLAFFFVLTLVPIIALILSVASNLHIPTNVINTMVENQFPNTIVEFVKYLSSNEKPNGLTKCSVAPVAAQVLIILPVF